MSGPDDFTAWPFGPRPGPAGGPPAPGEAHPDAAISRMIECAAVRAALQTTATVRQRSLQDFLR